MTPNEENPLLVAVATTIADGLPVDWESLLAANPEITEELMALRVLEEMEVARRRTASEDDSG
jgi:hypothetical protein